MSSGEVKPYFAYGSNMLRIQMAARCPESKFIGPACLREHRLEFTRRSTSWGGSGVADIVMCPGSHTWGGLYAVTERDLQSLDLVEGHPHAYERKLVVVARVGGDTHEAWAYTVVNKIADAVPSWAYWRALVDGARDCGLPADYIAMLEALTHSEVDR